MSNKTLRKELEISLVKNMDEVLVKVNSVAAKKIKKYTQDAAKTVAKKFAKTVKTESKIKKTVAKPASKKTNIAAISAIKAPIKKTLQKIKTKA